MVIFKLKRRGKLDYFSVSVQNLIFIKPMNTKGGHFTHDFTAFENTALDVHSVKTDITLKESNQLLQLCTARTAWSYSLIRSASVIRFASVIKLVSDLFGKCTTLVVTIF